MKLTLDKIKEITCGAAYVAEESGRLLFHRFTKEQAEAYFIYRGGDFPMNPLNALTTAGIRLAFATDSKTLSFKYGHNNEQSCAYAWIEVFVNGEAACHFGIDLEQKDMVAEASLGEGMKNVEVYLPWPKQVYLSDITIDDGAVITPVKRSKVMINYGDSITHGYVTQRTSLSYAARLARMLDADNYNKAVGGDRFFPELLDLDEPVKNPDYITVAYGTNDWKWHSRETIAKRSRDFFVKLSEKFPNAKIFAISPIWRDTNREKCLKFGGEPCEVHGILEKSVAGLENIVLINGWNLVPHDISCYTDALHPQDFGMGFYADNLYREIEKYL